MNALPLILLGAGGHAKVLLDMLVKLDCKVLGLCDPALHRQGVTHWRHLPVIGDDSIIDSYQPDQIQLVNGAGSLPGQTLRSRLHNAFTAKGYHFATVIHPTAVIGEGVLIGKGTQVMAGVIIQADTLIGNDVILNTGARIDHDCTIEDHVHIASGAVLAGSVRIGERCHIGAGAVLIQGVTTGVGAIVGAGTTVLMDVPAGYQQTGQPPRQPTRVHKESL